MKKLKYYIIGLLFLFTLSSCHQYAIFGIIGDGKRNYYTRGSDNAPGSTFNTHKRYYKKRTVNQNYKKNKYKKYKGIDRGCPF